MNQAEKLGAELVMMIRRESELLQELEQARIKINALSDQIRDMDARALYSSHSGEYPVIPTVDQTWPPRATREDADGGSTFHFTPTGDALTEEFRKPVDR